MEKSIFEQIGGTYYQQNVYLLPCLIVPDSPPIGVWGQRHLLHLKKHRQSTYTALFLTGRLDSYLTEIDQRAEKMFFQFVEQMAKLEGVTEQLKAYNEMAWTHRMNSIRNRATEIINTELITA